jgi:hypothetical protein
VKRTTQFTRVLACVALSGATLACTRVLASCDSVQATPDAALADSGLDAFGPPRDGSRGDVADSGVLFDSDAGVGCEVHAGWQQAHPFHPLCTLQLAPRDEWSSLALPMRTCNNGQARCAEVVVPLRPPKVVQDYGVDVMGTEDNGFMLTYNGNVNEPSCRTVMRIVPSAVAFAVEGVAEMNTNGYCRAIPEYGNADLLLTTINNRVDTRAYQVLLTPWAQYSPFASAVVANAYGNSYHSRDTIFNFDDSRAQVDIVDIPASSLLRSSRYPPSLREWNPTFPIQDELWGIANFGELGKSELWRVDRSGKFTAIRQKTGVHIFAPHADGSMLYWSEGSGNNAALFPQPKVEIWAATFSKDPNVVSQTAHRLVDVSGLGDLRNSVAHNGFYASNLGTYEIIVVRGRDGAVQRIPLIGGWGAARAYFVDEHQVWFDHGAPNGRNSGVARIMLDPWPP